MLYALGPMQVLQVRGGVDRGPRPTSETKQQCRTVAKLAGWPTLNKRDCHRSWAGLNTPPVLRYEPTRSSATPLLPAPPLTMSMRSFWVRHATALVMCAAADKHAIHGCQGEGTASGPSPAKGKLKKTFRRAVSRDTRTTSTSEGHQRHWRHSDVHDQ